MIRPLSVQFASAVTGLGFQLRDAAGSAVGSRVTSGIVNFSLGYYRAGNVDTTGAVMVHWDADGGNYADEPLDEAPDSAGVTTLLTRLSAARAAYLDNLSGGAVALASGVVLAAAQSLYAPAKAGDAMTLTGGERTAIGTAVWSAPTRAITDKAGFTIAGTLTSLDLLTANLTAVHGGGSWASAGLTTDQAAQLTLIASRAVLISAGMLTVTSPVSQSGRAMSLVRGCDYLAADGTAALFDLPAGVALTGGTVVLRVGSSGAVLEFPAAVTAARSVRVELTRLQTLTLTAGLQTPYELHATLSSGDVLPPLVHGTARISDPL